MKLNFKNSFFVLATVIAFVFILNIASSLLIPLAFALLISITLYPAVSFLNRKGVGLVWSILISMIGVILIISGIIYFFSAQIVDIASDYESFINKLNGLYGDVLEFSNSKINFIPEIHTEDIKSKLLKTLTEKGMPLMSGTLSFTSTFLSFFVITIIYIFLILLYHNQLVNGMVMAVKDEHKTQFRNTLKKVQNVGQKYLTGMGTLMLILGTLNTIGLLILGIDYAFFFGFLAAFLAIIPYIGTTLGGLLPTLYAFMTYDSYWYPLGVIIVFWAVQTIEGNFLSPKIVGGNLNLNALTALISLLAGGMIWGVAGMILLLPYMAIFKVFCENYDELKPIAALMADNSSSDDKPNKLFAKLRKKIGKK